MASEASVAAVHLIALRHGESTLNAQGRLTGQLDPPLTPSGRVQARRLAPLAARPYDLRLHSGARRAEETLRLACDAAGLPGVALEADARWRERSYGELEGGPPDAWRQPIDIDAAPPGGESYRQLGMRVLAAVDDLHDRAAAAGRPLQVLLCAHSGVLRMLRGIAECTEDLAPLLGDGAGNAEALELTYIRAAAPVFLTT
ncbi:histidine phosphatase family protein [Baekduia soli]|uniref:phosphoglycerate mutase (2,3-diphosphoglycerate-dependent) n=1 Tax=Baekduia soli TaxID=496014 RepID=A0A5B8U4I4_9ACTN|nr:histidine phosphatase family protein [Baekduia soli]QEC47795.1 histidine phosphatase family protein [Baekduia soli]